MKKIIFKNELNFLSARQQFISGDTVKLGDKKCFDKEQIGVKGPFSVTNCQSILHKGKEHLALRNNLRVTKKFLINKFDSIEISFNYFPYTNPNQMNQILLTLRKRPGLVAWCKCQLVKRNLLAQIS